MDDIQRVMRFMNLQCTTPRLVISAAFLFVTGSLSIMLSLGCVSMSQTSTTTDQQFQSSAALQPNFSQDCGWADDIPDSSKSVQVDVEPEMIYAPPLEYPKMARTAGLQGTVQIVVLVCESGQVGRMWILESSGVTSLDHVALAQAQKCRYKPAMKDGHPVKYWFTYPVDFRLDEM